MPLYRYVKAVVIESQPQVPLSKRDKSIQVLNRFLPNIFIIVGAIVLTVVAQPFVAYQLTAQRWQEQILLAPVSEAQMAEVKGIISPLGAVGQPSEVLGTQTIQPEVVSGVDFTKASNWFPTAAKGKLKTSKVIHYRLSIPKLKIDQALVEIGGDDLDKSLIHYSGTALPGEYGNVVIFGHSVLPIFYEPKNYRTIFSLLATLEKGDEIYLDYDGVQYKYVVDNYSEVRPEEIEVLEQRFDRRSMTLITCVPPGTYLRRGVIQAYLVKL